MESFVSRDILDKTMGSNVPVLRHLAEEAAQQKSRHIVLVYGESAALVVSVWFRSIILVADPAGLMCPNFLGHLLIR